jgi:hypothetical protein
MSNNIQSDLEHRACNSDGARLKAGTTGWWRRQRIVRDGGLRLPPSL